MVENKDDDYSRQDLQDMLKIYYKRLFPRTSFYRWLTYSFCKLISIKILFQFSSDFKYSND